METFLKILPYIVNIISGILLACATYTINKARQEREKTRQREEEKSQAIADGVQCLLRESIVSNYNEYHEKGYCPIYAKESLKRLFNAYSGLHGNDVASQLYHELLEMPNEPQV